MMRFFQCKFDFHSKGLNNNFFNCNIFSWLNHFIHTDILILIVIEMVILHRQYPKRKCFNLLGLSTLIFCYMFWLHKIHDKTGYWVYPILATLNFVESVVFHAFNVAVALAFYFLGWFLNSRIWNEAKVERIISSREVKVESV